MDVENCEIYLNIFTTKNTFFPDNRKINCDLENWENTNTQWIYEGKREKKFDYTMEYF